MREIECMKKNTGPTLTFESMLIRDVNGGRKIKRER
jgi:hypothetical protein